MTSPNNKPDITIRYSEKGIIPVNGYLYFRRPVIIRENGTVSKAFR
jgi:hypothetical protein